MPRRPKGPRLYLRAGRVSSKNGARLPDIYFIRDGAVEIGTGCGAERLHDAERALADYITAKWTPDDARGIYSQRDPAQVGVAEVLALYARERAPELKSDPVSTSGFIKNLLGWWGDMMVADVRRSTCKAYVGHRTTQPIRHGNTGRMVSDQTARRELEVLSAAIGHWHGEDALTTRPKVWLPEKPESPRDALTRSQVAGLLKASLGYEKLEDGRWERRSSSAQANRAHLRRFILIGIYTGTRHDVITQLLWKESPTQAWVDLEKGMIYRRGKAERENATKRRPVVKLSPRLLAHLRRWRAADLKRATAHADRLKEAGLKPESDPRFGTVLHHGGLPLSGKIRRGFAGCVADAALPHEITPHWMRHTCATWLMEAGAEPWEAAGYTGMTTAVLEKYYGHHRPDHQSGALRALGKSK